MCFVQDGHPVGHRGVSTGQTAGSSAPSVRRGWTKNVRANGTLSAQGERHMMTISKAYLHNVIGGAGAGHGPINVKDGIEFDAIAQAGRQVDKELPFGKFSEEARTA